MSTKKLKFEVMAGGYAVCRLANDAPVPSWIDKRGFSSITRTDEELSILTLAGAVPETVEAERDWVGFRIAGRLAFTETGILAQIAGSLADAGIPIFVVSTFNTDYLFVPDSNMETTRRALISAGHVFGPVQP